MKLKNKMRGSLHHDTWSEQAHTTDKRSVVVIKNRIFRKETKKKNEERKLYGRAKEKIIFF